MKINQYFELVNIDNDYMIIPIGEMIDHFNGTVIVNDVSAFLFEKLREGANKKELIELLTKEYEVDKVTAEADMEIALQKMRSLGIILD